MKPHPLDVLSLFFGALFTVLGAASLFSLEEAAFPSWTIPSIAIAVGAMIVGLSVRPARRPAAAGNRDGSPEPGPDDPGAPSSI